MTYTCTRSIAVPSREWCYIAPMRHERIQVIGRSRQLICNSSWPPRYRFCKAKRQIVKAKCLTVERPPDRSGMFAPKVARKDYRYPLQGGAQIHATVEECEKFIMVKITLNDFSTDQQCLFHWCVQTIQKNSLIFTHSRALTPSSSSVLISKLELSKAFQCLAF
jgi:hypothetical protein